MEIFYDTNKILLNAYYYFNMFYIAKNIYFSV